MNQEKQFSPRLSRLADAIAGAKQALESGRLADADAILRQVLREDSAQPEALHLLAIVNLRAGQASGAVRIIDTLLQSHPDVAAFRATAADICRQSGNAAKAADHAGAAVSLNPRGADGHYQLALALAESGNDAAAIEPANRAVSLAPNFANAFYLRAGLLVRLGQLSQAEADYRRTVALAPGHADALNNLGTLLLELQRPAEAVAAFKGALTRRPDYIVALNNLIVAHKERGQFDEAVATAHRVLQLSPGNAKALARLAAVLIERRDAPGAIAALTTLVATHPEATFFEMLGQAQSLAGNVEKAATAYRKAVELKPDLASAYARHGKVLEELGQFDEAIAALEKAIELDPKNATAHLDLANAKSFRSVEDPHFKAIEAQTKHIPSMPAEAQMVMHFAAAKAFDDVARHDEAFAHLLKGNKLKRQSITYDEWSTLDFFDRIKETMSADFVSAKAGSGDSSRAPIFILGMPRSGTTLVGRILAGHSRVASAGEVNDFGETIEGSRRADGRPVRFPESLPQLAANDLAAIGANYADRLKRRVAGPERIVDKANGNFLFTGLIHLALPQAKIVHVSRNPADTCLSCFAQLFDGTWNATYELAELGRYYRAYQRLMQHWREVLPAGAFLDVRYEDVVADLEGQSRRLLAYCDLEWDARVLDFHTVKAPVQTASALQVRQPLYRSSVGRARPYLNHLAPLLAELERD